MLLHLRVRAEKGTISPCLATAAKVSWRLFPCTIYHTTIMQRLNSLVSPSLISSPDPPNFAFPGQGILFRFCQGKLRCPRFTPARANGCQPRQGTQHHFPAPLTSSPPWLFPSWTFLKAGWISAENKTLFPSPKKTPTQEPNGNDAIEIQCKIDLQLM